MFMLLLLAQQIAMSRRSRRNILPNIVINPLLLLLVTQTSGDLRGFDRLDFEFDHEAISHHPNGPYIVAGVNSSELVIFPDPLPPSKAEERSDCPHLQPGISRWHDPSIWGRGGVPDAGTDFSLPPNTRVVLDQPTTRIFGIITIPESSELILGENSDGVNLDMTGMKVYGKLLAGSRTCRIETPVSLTLHGTRPLDAVPNTPPPHVKGIAVDGGVISLHGKRYFRTWTRLAQTVEPNTNTILLQHPVNWESGDQIVLVTTAMKDSKEWHQNEVLTIENVDNDSSNAVGAIILVRETIKYRHVANLGYQGEVALISRTLVVQGAADDSEPSDPDPLDCQGQSHWGYTGRPCADKDLTGFGGHVIVFNGGIGSIEGVRFYRMGQTNVLGRYPIHFHLLGSCTDCYVKDSSFLRSYYRCISIHVTNNVLVEENVAYDITGFCYYLEDGIEENNTLAFNLAAHIHVLGDPASGSSQRIPPVQASNTLSQPADVSASGFYCPNLNNWIVGNAASGVSVRY